jgi:hypothetical protein
MGEVIHSARDFRLKPDILAWAGRTSQKALARSASQKISMFSASISSLLPGISKLARIKCQFATKWPKVGRQPDLNTS